MRIFIGDLLTGRHINDVPFLSAEWAAELNAAGSVSAKIDLRDPQVRTLGMYNAAYPGKTFLAVADGDHVLEAGPIWMRSYDRESGVLSVGASGLWSYFDARTLVPNIGDMPVIDPVTGESAAWANSSWKNLHLGTIGKRIIEQSMTWPGGNLPIVFEDDKPGSHERNYLGADLARIGQMLQNLTEVEDGPDIGFFPEWMPDRMGVRWRYVSGDPRLVGSRPHRVDVTVPKTALDRLSVADSGVEMGALGWCSAGRASDTAIIERVSNAGMLAAGFPLLERVDSSRSTVTLAETARAYASELARTGGKPVSSWSVSVHTGGVGEPQYTDFRVGDLVEFKITDDLFIPDGVYTRRIVNVSGSAGDPVLKLGLGETYG